MEFSFPTTEKIRFRAWKKAAPPRKILVIRLHAFGDLVAAMPAAQALKNLNPTVEMHLLVCEAYADLPRNMPVFNKIHTFLNARGGWPMGLEALKMLPKLRAEQFEVVIDLQKNRFSQLIRRSLFPQAWSEFDRFSKEHAVVRYQKTVNAVGLGQTEILQKISLRDETAGLEKLAPHSWNGHDRLVILNPCGLFSTRKWGLEKYLRFAKIWLETVDSTTQFLLLGLPSMLENADFLQKNLPENTLNLVGKTTARELFNLVRRADLTLSDDGGLLHVSWLSHVPTIGFLGASPSFWGRPLGEKSIGFTSDDLPCGNCHRTDCLFGNDDVRCLARVSPEQAVAAARGLLKI